MSFPTASLPPFRSSLPRLGAGHHSRRALLPVYAAHILPAHDQRPSTPVPLNAQPQCANPFCQKRTFELAVRRMLGSTRRAVVGMMLTEAVAYSIPAWTLGLLVSAALASVMLGAFRDISDLPISTALDGSVRGLVLLPLL